METVIPIVLAVVASTGFWTFVTTIYSNRKKKKSLDRSALLALLHDKLYSLMSQYLEAGHLSPEDYANIQYLYEPYIAMGGNGICKKLKTELEKLPLYEETDRQDNR